nr:MAG TPA: hypothetical protein [Caudoviricetes sp.]
MFYAQYYIYIITFFYIDTINSYHKIYLIFLAPLLLRADGYETAFYKKD